MFGQEIFVDGADQKARAPKRVALNMKATPALRQRIEEAASRSGLSIAQEVERRLIASIEGDDRVGGPHTRSFLSLLGAAIHALELRAGKTWDQDFQTFTEVRGAADRLLQYSNPGMSHDRLKKHADMMRESVEARQRAQRIGEQLQGFYRAVGVTTAGLQLEPGIGALLQVARHYASTLEMARPTWTDEQRQIERDMLARQQEATELSNRLFAEAQALFDEMSEEVEKYEAEGQAVADEIATAVFGAN